MKLVPGKPWYAGTNSQTLVTLSFVAIGVIAAADSVIVPYLALAFLYLIPLAIAAAFLSRLQILVVSAICAAFAEGFSNFPRGDASLVRAALVFGSYAFVTMLIHNLSVYRRFATRRLGELERDIVQVHASQNELELLMNSSALGIFAVSADGKIVRSNRAAHEIFGVGFGGLSGRLVKEFISEPLISGADGTDRTLRTANGERLQARVWTSEFLSGDNSVMAVFIESAAGRRNGIVDAVSTRRSNG